MPGKIGTTATAAGEIAATETTMETITDGVIPPGGMETVCSAETAADRTAGTGGKCRRTFNISALKTCYPDHLETT